MPTTDERREVAARLRETTAYKPICHIAIAVGMKCGDFTVDECIDCNEQTFARLADLIEPEPERTCRAVNTRDAGFNEWDFNCSECGHLLATNAFYRPNYCTNCGAKVVDK